MTYEDKNAAYALNSYLWKLLEANLGWTKVNGLTPIIPVAQQPELMQSGEPFIVYGSAIHQPQHLYVMRKEAVSYMIYATTVGKINETVDLLVEAFERQDEAAIDVNEWLDTEAAGRGEHRGVYFSTIRVTMAEKAEDAAEEEGGYVVGLVMLETRYTKDSGGIQTTGFTYE